MSWTPAGGGTGRSSIAAGGKGGGEGNGIDGSSSKTELIDADLASCRRASRLRNRDDSLGLYCSNVQLVLS
jgi:hypothetical protein